MANNKLIVDERQKDPVNFMVGRTKQYLQSPAIKNKPSMLTTHG